MIFGSYKREYIIKKFGDRYRLLVYKGSKPAGSGRTLEFEEENEYDMLPWPVEPKEVEEKKEYPKDEGSERFMSSIYRAKGKIYELAVCNEWQYFITLTINPVQYDRENLHEYRKAFSSFIQNYMLKLGLEIKYLLIPELHKDKKTWHMHGFISGLPREELIINKNGFLDWPAYYERFGYCSLGQIRDKERISCYITKYIGKGLEETSIPGGFHLYYASKGLKLAEKVKEGVLHKDILEKVKFEWDNDYLKVMWLDYGTMQAVLNDFKVY